MALRVLPVGDRLREMDLEKTTSVGCYAPESTSEDVPISGVDMAAVEPRL